MNELNTRTAGLIKEKNDTTTYSSWDNGICILFLVPENCRGTNLYIILVRTLVRQIFDEVGDMSKRTTMLTTFYELFEPLSNSKPQFNKNIVYVSDVADIVQPLASPVTILKLRRMLGIASCRIAGKPAWRAPTVPLNQALRYGGDALATEQKRKDRTKERAGNRLTPVVKEFMIEQGLVVPCRTAKSLFREWRESRGMGPAFTFSAFSRAVKNLGITKIEWKGNKHYYLNYEEQERIEWMDGFFENNRTVPEKVILNSCEAAGYHPAALLQLGVFELKDGLWYAEGNKQIVYNIKAPWEGK